MPQSYLKGNVNYNHRLFVVVFKYRNCSIFARLKKYALVLTDLRFKNGATGNASGPDMRSSVPTPLLLFTSLEMVYTEVIQKYGNKNLAGACVKKW